MTEYKIFDNDEELVEGMLDIILDEDDVCVICDFDDANMFADCIDRNSFNKVEIDIDESDIDEDMPYYMVGKVGDMFIIQPIRNEDGEFVRHGFDKVYIAYYVDDTAKDWYTTYDSTELVLEEYSECQCECCQRKKNQDKEVEVGNVITIEFGDTSDIEVFEKEINRLFEGLRHILF